MQARRAISAEAHRETQAHPGAGVNLAAPSSAAGGNQRRLRALQAKLEIGSADDPLEREADHAADRVVRGLPAAVGASAGPAQAQRKCDAREDEDKHKVQRKSAGAAGAREGGPAPAAVGQALSAPGRPLDGPVQSMMSTRFGRDLSAVRIHDDTQADASARAIGARAYTAGADVVFAAGRYAPHTEDGQRLLAHELAHTIQQGEGGALIQRDGPDPPLKEAKKEDATGAVEGGLKTLADKAGDNDKLKDFGKSVATKVALPIWTGASTADKAAMVVGGAAIYGTGVAALASNEAGRSVLSGVDFVAPIGLLPYATLSGFSFDKPKSKLDPLLLHFKFKGDDLLELAHSKLSYVPPVTLEFDMTLAVSPDGKTTTPYAFAKFGVLPGVTVAGGFGVATDLPQLTGTAGGLAETKSYPQPAQPAPRGGEAVFVSIDLLKAPILPKAVRAMLGADPKDLK